jgi:hypothetical protein
MRTPVRIGRGKRRTSALLLALVALTAPAARAIVCALDNVPAATLLLPYFEVDLADSLTGRTTLLSITNTGSPAALAHVVLWTNYAVPTFAFDVYLTGFDVQTINLRDVFGGRLPATADLAHDPDDTISPRGPLSGDSSFPGCDGLLPPPAASEAELADLRQAHSGLPLSDGRCAGGSFGDLVARGYATIDVVTRCSILMPGDPGYFGPGGVAGYDNVLIGDFFYVDGQRSTAEGFNLVRIEAAPSRFGPGSRTFYRTQVGGSGADGREPLPTLWAQRYFNGGTFNGGADLIVWRDSEAARAPFPCDQPPSGFPLPQVSILAFDEQESVTGIPALCGVPCPNLPPQVFPFPLAANRVTVGAKGGALSPPYTSGWLALDLATGAGSLAASQSWVGVVVSANGHFQVAYEATPLASGCAPTSSYPF